MKIKRYPQKSARIEMMPLIDVVFLLLVFFLYAMLSMAVHRGLQLQLPESGATRVSEDSPVSVSVKLGAEGIETFVNKRQVPLAMLGETVWAEYRAASGKPPVLVFAEENVSYQQLFSVLDQLNGAGIDKISLQARQKR